MVGRGLTPCAAKDIEGISARAAYPVVGRTHDKCSPLGYGAELADYEPVAELRVVEEHVVALKACGVGVIVVICVIAYLYVRRGYHVLYKA